MNKKLLVVLVVTFFSSFQWVIAAPEGQGHEEYGVNRYWRDFVLGGASGIVEVTVNQPIVYIKNWLQQPKLKRKPFECSPKVWYRGYAVNAGSMGPITAVQMSVNAILKSFLIEEGEPELSEEKKVFAGFLAGALSAVISAPAEHAMIRQQFSGANLYVTAQELYSQGRQAFFRGLIPTAVRDGKFAAAYIAVAPWAQRQMLSVTENETSASLLGSAFTGVGTTLLTQPWDMIKTTMQSHGNPITVRETLLQLYREGGVVHFWAASVPRGFRVILAIDVMSRFQRSMKAKMGW